LNWNGIVSLFIAFIELLLLIGLLIFSEKNKINRILYYIIALLAVYQALEYFICGLGVDSSFTTYLAFVDISFLPPLNLVLIFTIVNADFKLKYLLFIPAAFFTVYYLLILEQFAAVHCTVLYATYNYPHGDLYGFFYYIPILLSFLFLLKKKNAIDKKQFVRLVIAYLFIILPVVTGFVLLYLNLPGIIQSMESLLCKFAFGYAIALSIFSLNNRQKNN